VRHRGYEKLPPIVIQGSYTLPKNQDEALEELVQQSLDSLFFTGENQTLVVTAFESVNEITMKKYLLKPHKRVQIADGKFWLVQYKQGQKSILDNLWQFVKDKYFVCIHLQYDTASFIKGFDGPLDKISEFITNSDICIGILPKRGNASVKSMLKVYKLEDHYESHMKDQKKILPRLINCEGAQI
jgi:hypothetical protein